jgi:hypothetical protein
MTRRLAICLLAFAAVSCLPPSQQDLQTAQALVELGDAMNEIRLMLGDVQDQIDSLKMVAARQDTVIRQLANLAGVTVPR